MTDHASKTQHYTFVNAAKMASKAFQGKPVTLMGKVDKVASSSEFTLRSTDGKFYHFAIPPRSFVREISIELSFCGLVLTKSV